MFTGIVEEVGEVADLVVDGERAVLRIRCRTVLDGTSVGDSIAVDGACLTVAELLPEGPDAGFRADLMAETLRTTALGDHRVGDPVNLERALAVGDRLGGHLVQGHVDGVGRVTDRVEQPGTLLVTVRAPAHVGRYLVPKGSVTVAGVSLTVVDTAIVEGEQAFGVGLIPHTCEATTLGRLAVGDRVNLEADVVAKYVERLLVAGAPSPYQDRR